MLRKHFPEENSLMSNNSVTDNQRRKNETEVVKEKYFEEGK